MLLKDDMTSAGSPHLQPHLHGNSFELLYPPIARIAAHLLQRFLVGAQKNRVSVVAPPVKKQQRRGWTIVARLPKAPRFVVKSCRKD